MSTRADYAKAILSAGGWPGHLNNFVSLVGWMEAEGTKAKWNPLATTRPEPHSTDFNTTGVKNYRDLSTGVAATVETLRNGRYVSIIACLHRADPAATTLSVVNASPWGTHIDQIPSFVGNIRDAWTTYAFKAIAT